jgi:uroporphyrin-III C-methyltransferase
MTHRGIVSLVGAGPGDPELITVRGLNRLRSADVVIYDRLIDPRLLDHVSNEAERIFVGKARGAAVMSQRAIEAIMIERARAGNRVVRLKGGDPFVFGRGGEEIEALAAAGIEYEVVPGITSAIAGPAGAGIPVTHRGLSAMFTVVTGHQDPSGNSSSGRRPSGSSVDWTWLAHGNGTLVILMGLEQIETICDRLIAGGRAPNTPAAVISAATWPTQRTVTATLADLAAIAAEAYLQSPALIVIGDVVAFADALATPGAALARAV